MDLDSISCSLSVLFFQTNHVTALEKKEKQNFISLIFPLASFLSENYLMFLLDFRRQLA